MLLLCELLTTTPIDPAAALSKVPIKWRLHGNYNDSIDVDLTFTIPPFSFYQLRAWDLGMRGVKIATSIGHNLDLQSIILYELDKDSSPLSLNYVLHTVREQFGGVPLYLSDLLMEVSRPEMPTVAADVCLRIGATYAATWWSPNRTAEKIVAPQLLKHALADIMSRTVDPVSCGDLMTAITRANLDVKKKLLGANRGEEQAVRPAWQSALLNWRGVLASLREQR